MSGYVDDVRMPHRRSDGSQHSVTNVRQLEPLHRPGDPGRRGSRVTFRRLIEPQLVDTGEEERGTDGSLPGC